MTHTVDLSPRLLFDGSTGIAKLLGVMRPLYRAPVLLGRSVGFVDYRPEAGYAQVRFPGEQLREMTAEERVFVDSHLYALTQGSAR